jgi:ribosomal protein L18E
VTDEQHLWSCALEVERQHGDRAALFVAARIGALALEADESGVRRWKDIAARLSQLRRADASHST